MKKALISALIFAFFLAPTADLSSAPALEQPSSKVYIIPIRDDIMPPLVYLVRRGVKEAMEQNADVLILDMETNGGRVDTTEEIIRVLNQFPKTTVTYVNRKAFSAGAFIAVATKKIYMAPQSVIGAAAPLLMAPGGGSVEISETVEAKMTSGIRALVRANAEKNGHNVDVVEAMIDKTKELKIDGEVLNEKGQILTLTDTQARKEYGNPPKPLLSSGTVENLDALMKELGFDEAQRVYVKPTGAERLATWINALSPLLLLIGVLGIYVEIKTPGFGLPGIVGLVAFALYFFGGYIAGLSGAEWIAVFVLGLILFILEVFFFPGTVVLGLTGAALILASIIMAMVDIYPSVPGIPRSVQIHVPMAQILTNLSVAILGSLIGMWIISIFLPRTPLYAKMISSSASGEVSVNRQSEAERALLGMEGVTTSALRPGGKVQFGDRILDVVTSGEMIERGRRVKIIGFSTSEPIVEAVA